MTEHLLKPQLTNFKEFCQGEITVDLSQFYLGAKWMIEQIEQMLLGQEVKPRKPNDKSA